MFVIEQRPHNVYVSVSRAHGDTVTVTATSHEAYPTLLTLSPDQSGTLCQLHHCGRFLMSVCYLPTLTMDDVLKLDATNTLFITKDGCGGANHSILLPHLQMEDTLMFQRPHDSVHVIVPPALLNPEDGVLQYVDNGRHLITNAKVTVKRITVLKPVSGAPGLYIIIADAPDALEFTDIESGYVLCVYYTRTDATETSEYITVR